MKRIERSDLLDILRGNISYIDEVNKDSELDIDIIVYPKDVKRTLLAYLNDKITNTDLTKWADFINWRSKYSYPDREDENEGYEIADHYKDMWYVIQKLSTPFLDGDICHSRVKQYLSELDKYFEE